ncbi:MAG TPA: glucose-6-phosphate dehydrogenase assembly protein OpcA [Candidatus Dormibacteraeota bacterium]|nr:glucose-6-phosphate dehydrogenase assembly protein OpcA [Candidatus Dormibacteraeota bacterium]
MAATSGGLLRAQHVSGLHAVTRELAEMRASLLRAGDDTRSVRLSVLTLVVACADRESAEQAAQVVERTAASHPTRAIVLVADPAAEPRIEADLSLSCSATRGEQICVELVRLEVGGETALHLRSVVSPLLLPDVPVHLWLAGSPPLTQALSPDALELCERLVLDSDAYRDPAATLATLARAVQRIRHLPAVGDLAWSRIRSWRELVGRAFDTPELRGFALGIEEVEVRCASAPPSAEARLFAGWITSRLQRAGSPVPAVTHLPGYGSGGELLGVTIHARRRDRVARVEIGGEGERRTTSIAVEGGMRSSSATWTVGVERPGLVELVGTEIEEQGADPLYIAALLAAAADPP